jgi:hypothetical protein
MGDHVTPGEATTRLYVAPEMVAAFRQKLLPHASVLVPNQARVKPAFKTLKPDQGAQGQGQGGGSRLGLITHV